MDPTQAKDDVLPEASKRRIERATSDIAFAIENAFFDASDDGDYVGWHDTLDFEHDYLEATKGVFDPLVRAGSYDAALAAGIKALRCVEKLDVDDSFGFLDAAISDTIGLFKRLAKTGDDAFATRLVDAIATFLETPPECESERETFELQETDVAAFLFKRYEKRRAHAPRLETLARGRVEEARGRRDEHDAELARIEAELKGIAQSRQTTTTQKRRSSLEMERRRHQSDVQGAEYDLEIWMPRLLAARRLEGATLEELLEEAGDDRALDAVALYFADLAVKRHDTKQAIDFLETAVNYHGARGHHAREVRRKLADLLEPLDIEAMRRELLWLVGDAYGRHEVEIPELWIRLKESYDDSEWEQARMTLLASLETDQELACIHAEGRWDDLMTAIERLDEIPYSFEAGLTRRFPARVMRHYLLHPQKIFDLEARVYALWDKARATCTDEEWADTWPTLVDAMQKAEMRMAYLAREGAWERLMDEAEKAGVRSLDLYRNQLLEHCPERLFQAYVADLRARARLKRSSRQLYRDFVDRARALREMPGGPEVVDPIVAGMRERYRSRPALLEELDRL